MRSYACIRLRRLCNVSFDVVVFTCIDENRDNNLTKEEIMYFLQRKFDGKFIFPNNYLKSIELFETERSDKIDWSRLYVVEFVRLAREVPYIVFPAFRLQESLRFYTLGEAKWKKISKRMMNRKKNSEKEDEANEDEKEKKKKKQKKPKKVKISSQVVPDEADIET